MNIQRNSLCLVTGDCCLHRAVKCVCKRTWYLLSKNNSSENASLGSSLKISLLLDYSNVRFLNSPRVRRDNHQRCNTCDTTCHPTHDTPYSRAVQVCLSCCFRVSLISSVNSEHRFLRRLLYCMLRCMCCRV
jgi:hypothetical protein